jgi:putative ABC transport system permease protein
MEARLRGLGGRLVVVSPNKLPPYPGRPRQLDHFISLTPEDAEALAARVPHLHAAVPVAARPTTVGLRRRTARVRLIGTTPGYQAVRDFALARGRFLHTADEGKRVIVLGHAVSRELAPGGVRVGETVRLAGQPYEVAGVLASQGVNFAGEDEDHQVFVPVETYRRRVANRPWLNHLYLQLTPTADPAQTVEQVMAVLRERHGRWSGQVDDVIVRDLADLAAQQEGLLATTAWAVSVVSGLLLLLGIAGIGTLMQLVVRQRRAEIGLRRALGATPRDVAVQFFLEGVALAGVGTLAGVGLGVVTALALGGDPAPAAPDTELLIAAAGVSLGAGSLASLAPALWAARLEPATALQG